MRTVLNPLAGAARRAGAGLRALEPRSAACCGRSASSSPATSSAARSPASTTTCCRSSPSWSCCRCCRSSSRRVASGAAVARSSVRRAPVLRSALVLALGLLACTGRAARRGSGGPPPRSAGRLAAPPHPDHPRRVDPDGEQGQLEGGGLEVGPYLNSLAGTAVWPPTTTASPTRGCRTTSPSRPAARMGSPTTGTLRAPAAGPSIFSQLDAAGRTWKSYEESMPGDCRRTNAGGYAVRHNPAAYYTGLRSCSANDVSYGQLSRDLNSGSLPAFSFITPNLCDDMHDCPVSSGDRWLSQQLPLLLNSFGIPLRLDCRVHRLGRGRPHQRKPDPAVRRRARCSSWYVVVGVLPASRAARPDGAAARPTRASPAPPVARSCGAPSASDRSARSSEPASPPCFLHRENLIPVRAGSAARRSDR